MEKDLQYLKGLSDVSGETFFKQFADSLHHTVLVVCVESCKIQYINRVQPGFSMEQVLGADVFSFVSPEYHDAYRNLIREAAQTRSTKTLESVAASSNGKAWYRTFFTPLPNEKNLVNYVMLIAEDITENKLKSIEIIDRGEKLKAIINNTNDIIFSIDLNYNIIEYNTVFGQTIQRGYQESNIIGKYILNFIDPTKHEHLKRIYHRVEAGESCHDIEKFAVVNTDNFVFYETWYNPIRNNEGKVVGINIFSKNITERISYEEKLKAALEEKEILLSEIHHRIKNNLAIVSSMLHLQELNMETKEGIEALSQSRKRIKSTALVHELLYRNDSFANIELGEYAKELFNFLKPDKDIKLIVEGDDVYLNLETAMPLGLLLNELLVNSLKHSYSHTDSGLTKVRLAYADSFLKINYEDSHGSFPENLDFENSNSVGLTLINTFIQQLNGKIIIANKSPLKYNIQIPLNGR